MPRSMTGFGRGEFKSANDAFKVEIKTVNHRYLDWNIRLPVTLSSLENNIRNHLSRGIKRGRINVNVWHSRGEGASLSVTVNRSLVKSFREAVKVLDEEMGREIPLSLRDFFQVPDMIQVEQQEWDLEAVFEDLRKALDEAVENLLAERSREGLNLVADMFKRVEALQGMTAEIEERAPQIVAESRDRLRKRLDDILENTPLPPERFEAEIALLAERSDITEELVRLKSHLNQAKELLSQDECGGPLGFLAQELFREINTIGSKAGDLFVSQVVLSMKSEVDKIKEQTANLE